MSETTIKAGDKEVDIASALPLTLGDFRRLKREHGFTMQDVVSKSGDPEILFAVASLILTKVDKSITVEQVEAIEVSELGRLGRIMGESFTGKKQEQIDRPT